MAFLVCLLFRESIGVAITKSFVIFARNFLFLVKLQMLLFFPPQPHLYRYPVNAYTYSAAQSSTGYRQGLVILVHKLMLSQHCSSSSLGPGRRLTASVQLVLDRQSV